MATLNPRWIKAMCANRGLLDIELMAIEFGIAQLSEVERSRMYSLVFRLHGGTDDADDFEFMSKWLRTSRDVYAASGSNEGNLSKVEGSPEALEQSRAVRSLGVDLVQDPDRTSFLHRRQTETTRESHHVYGKLAALCVEPTVIEEIADLREPDFHTISLEMAPIKKDQKHFDWERKITLRLTKRELPLYCALLLGCMKTFQIKNHGQSGDKSLQVDDQGTHLFFKIRQGSKVLAVPVPPEEVYSLITMAIAVSVKNSPTLDSQTITAAIKRCATMVRADDRTDE